LFFSFNKSKVIYPNLEEYAIALGTQAKKYNNHVYYKDFVLQLIKDLTADYTQPQLIELSTFVERLATTRAKEEKSGNINHFIEETGNEEEL